MKRQQEFAAKYWHSKHFEIWIWMVLLLAPWNRHQCYDCCFDNARCYSKLWWRKIYISNLLLKNFICFYFFKIDLNIYIPINSMLKYRWQDDRVARLWSKSWKLKIKTKKQNKRLNREKAGNPKRFVRGNLTLCNSHLGFVVVQHLSSVEVWSDAGQIISVSLQKRQ